MRPNGAGRKAVIVVGPLNRSAADTQDAGEPTSASGGVVVDLHPTDGRPAARRLDEGALGPLVERARAGDVGAFEEIVRMLQGPLRSFARRMMHDAHLGDDAAQETFLRIWKGLPALEPRGRFVSWAFTVTRNTCIECLRREKRTPTPVETQDSVSEDPLETHALRRVVNDALAALDEPYRSTLLLRETGLAYDELAEALDCPVGTIRSRLHEARRRMAVALRPILGGES